MSSFDEIIRIHRVQRIELQGWIEQRWVRPRQTKEGYAFDEADEARIALIRELKEAFMVDDDALGVVLSLLDQLYATRSILRRVEEAVDTLPEPIRREFCAHLSVGEP